MLTVDLRIRLARPFAFESVNWYGEIINGILIAERKDFGFLGLFWT